MPELSTHGVICVAEERDGTLWFGGIDGLIRYNGMSAEWIPFDKELKSLIGVDPSREARCMSLLCMPDGGLVAVIDSVLCHFKQGQWTVLLDKLGSPGYQTRLVPAPDGTVWLLSKDVLRQFSADLSRHAEIIRASKAERLSSFCFDGTGDAWVVKSRPLKWAECIHIPIIEGRPREETQWSTYPIAVETPGRESSLCAGPRGNIWYVDNRLRVGVRSLDPGTGRWTTRNTQQAKNSYFYLFKDSAGILWASGYGSLLSIAETSSRFFDRAELRLPAFPFSVFEASDGTWWVITRGGPVYRMQPDSQQWKTYAGLQYDCETTDGTQWFRTVNSHAVAYDPDTGRWLEYMKEDGLPDLLNSIHTSSHGLVWAVGRHEGEAAWSVFDGKKWHRYRHSAVALGIYRDGILEASDGTMWIGLAGDPLPGSENAGGALQLEVKSGAPYLLRHHASPGFPYGMSCLAQTPDGTIWLGAPTVYQYKPEHDESARPVDGLPGVFTPDMAVDAKGELWVTKGFFGVYRRVGDGWQRFTASEGLDGNLFTDLLPLQDGTLLVASDRGISRFDEMARPAPVFSGDFAMALRGGSMRQSKDGALWFNFSENDPRSPRVLMNLKPSERFCSVRYRPDSHPPETVLTEHPDQVDSEGNMHISWAGHDAWAHTPTERLCFSWRMDGREWSPFTRETGRTFLGIKSGRHVLEIRARDHDFNIDPTPARTMFTVARPVWQRPWVILLVVLALGGLVTIAWILIYYHDKGLKLRAQYLEEMDQVKTSFYTNLSHELRTPLSVMQGPLEHLLQLEKDEIKIRFLHLIKRSSDRVSNLMGQMLDFRKLEQGKMQMNCSEGDFAVHVREAVELLKPMAQKQHVACEMNLDEPCIGLLDPDKLRKIVTNLAGNAIKYTSEGGRIVVSLNRMMRDVETVALVIEDNGAGIGPQDLEHIFDRFYRVSDHSMVEGSGIGLNLTKELVELWGGTIRVESPVHDDASRPGARFTVELPQSGQDHGEKGFC